MPKKEVTGFRLVFGYLGMFLVLVGLITATPLLMVAFYQDETAALPLFGYVAAFDIVLGFSLYFSLIFKRRRMRFLRHQEFLLLMLTWLSAIVSGAAPFFIAHLMGNMNMPFSAAFFESTSGYSTTGLTLFEEFIDVPDAFCPHVFTFHRAFLNFIGGVGLVLLLSSVLGAGAGISLYVSEGHSDKLLPNIAKSAKLIFGIYTFYTIIGVFLLMGFGMPTFDAVCHSMSALSGGGFSPRANNVASFRVFEGEIMQGGFLPVNSLGIEIVIMVLVCLSAIAFMLHTFLLRGKVKTFLRDDETRFALISWVIFLAVCFFGACAATSAIRGNFFGDSGEILRQSAFYTIGSMTNSGFSSTSGNAAFYTYHIVEGSGNLYLGHTFTLGLIVLMLIGGGAGSSAGGIKQYRIAIALRSLWYSTRYRFASIHQKYPKLTNRFGEIKELDDEQVHGAHHYIFLFLGMYLILTLVILIADPQHYGFESAAFDMASAVSNTGLSWVVGPSYIASKEPAAFVVVWAMSIGMLLGRLEIFPAAYAASNIYEEVRYRKILKRRAKREAALLELSEGE